MKMSDNKKSTFQEPSAPSKHTKGKPSNIEEEISSSNPPDSVSSRVPDSAKRPAKRRNPEVGEDNGPDKKIKPKVWSEEDVSQIVNILRSHSNNNSLTDSGEGVNKLNSENDTYLHIAADLCNFDAIRWLLSHNATVDAEDARGATPLARCVAECPSCAQILIQAGADVNHQDVDGIAPLHRAALNPECLELLLSKSALVNIFDRHNGSSPLHDACWGGNLKCVQALVARGVSVDLTIKHAKNAGASPLHYAAQQDHDSVVDFLLTKGSKPDQTDSKGCTPLHYAAFNGATRAMAVLIRHKARTDIKDKEGRTALDLAHLKNRTVAQKMLAQAPGAGGAAGGSLGRRILAALRGVAGFFSSAPDSR